VASSRFARFMNGTLSRSGSAGLPLMTAVICSMSPRTKRGGLLNFLIPSSSVRLSAPSATDNAAEANIAAGLVITVELDKRPRQARETIIGVLNTATAEVRSGGIWRDGDHVEDKLHLHWRLNQPATGLALAALKKARMLASRLVGGDSSNDPVNHPIRWPGGYHNKTEPRLCKIIALNADIEVDLDTALEALEKAAAAGGVSVGAARSSSGGHAGGVKDWTELFGGILEGNDLHANTTRFAAKLVTLGVTGGAAVNMIRGLLEHSAAPRDDRFNVRFSDVPKLVRSAEHKFKTLPPAQVRDVLTSMREAQGDNREVRFREGVDVIRGLISRRELGAAEGERALQVLKVAAQKINLPFEVAQAILENTQ
jgi:hypothetical protein